MATSPPVASRPSSPPRAPSAGVGGVPLASALRDLLRFVLSAHVAAPDPAFPLSPSYCSRLLLDDGDDGDLFGNLVDGLARGLEEGRLPGPPAVAAGIPVAEAEEGSEEKREREWEAVLREKGAELKRMYDAVEFELHVQEPYFTQLKAGAKTVEGRLATVNYNRITQDSSLLFNKCLLLNVEAVMKYSSFSEMLQVEMISNVLPGISSIEEGVKVYRKFYTEEKENSYGVLAISVLKPLAQPYITMTDILAGLGYDGLGRLLGMAKTAGTVPDGLPPPRSALISSCMKLHQPHRSMKGWWGSFNGSGKATIKRYSSNWWLPLCVMVPDGLRMVQRFIGFLEPYTPEGFSKGWKH
ncbi:hypothetical protein ACP4OV_013156 [Aristida adscensionis]